MNDTNALIVPDNLISSPDEHAADGVPSREFSFPTGDRRFHERGRAIAHAEEKALETGRRQAVRLGKPATFGGPRLWVVQEVGS